jgi:hemolysin III
MEKAGTFNGQSFIEEIFNSLSHGVGALMAIVAFVWLMGRSATTGDAMLLGSMMVYGLSLVVLYTFSTLYHAAMDFGVKSRLQVVDHCSIFILIWGTYVPVAINLIGGRAGWTIVIIQTLCMAAGIYLNSLDMKKYKKVSLVLYVIMGWCIVFNMKPLLAVIDRNGLELLFAGGIAYTVGILFYIRKEKHFYHTIWHLFVMAGSIFHFAFMISNCF